MTQEVDFDAYWQLKAYIISWMWLQFIVEYIKKSFADIDMRDHFKEREKKQSESWNVRAHERQQTIPKNGIECRIGKTNIKNQWRPVKKEWLNEKYAAIELILDQADTNKRIKAARRLKKRALQMSVENRKGGTADNRESKWLQVCNEYMKSYFTTKDENLQCTKIWIDLKY